jgi:hypothetical protein
MTTKTTAEGERKPYHQTARSFRKGMEVFEVHKVPV